MVQIKIPSILHCGIWGSTALPKPAVPVKIGLPMH